MGQAKRRGSFENRKKMAIIRDEANMAIARQKEIQRRAKMTDEEKRIEFKNKIFFSQLMLMSITNGYLPYKI